MPSQTIDNKVKALERRVTKFEELPERVTAVESQIVQLRTEMRDEFSAVRREMRDEFSSVRQEMRDGLSAVRQEMREGDEETRRYMRVLHEDVIGRLAAIQEGQPSKQPRRSKPSGS